MEVETAAISSFEVPPAAAFQRPLKLEIESLAPPFGDKAPKHDSPEAASGGSQSPESDPTALIKCESSVGDDSPKLESPAAAVAAKGGFPESDPAAMIKCESKIGDDAPKLDCPASDPTALIKYESTVGGDATNLDTPESDPTALIEYESTVGGDVPILESPETATGDSQESDPTAPAKWAALTVQKVYRSYRTRRRLADSCVVAEELWWQAIDFVRLNYSTISFFDYLKPESPHSRWNRVSLNASKVGKGLSKDEKAKTLAFQHWIEAIDPRHRYGHNLHLYYEEWSRGDAGQPFFYWLDIGDGRDVDIKECPRSLLQQQCIQYLGPKEREHYEYVPKDGRIMHKQTGELIDTTKGSEQGKWIFVMSTTKRFYAGQKKKGIFHHSSFLAGGVTLAAGRFTAENGKLKAIWAYSGHYRPSDDNLKGFLAYLGENGINIDEIVIRASSNEEYFEDGKEVLDEKVTEGAAVSDEHHISGDMTEDASLKQSEDIQNVTLQADEIKANYKRTLSGGLQSPKAEVPPKAVLQRINSKKATSSYQLGHQLSLKWSTGAGPRIGCVKDYPLELRVQALEFVNLSPRVPPTPSASRKSPSSQVSPKAIDAHFAT